MRKITNKAVTIVLFAIVFASSLPLMVNYCIDGKNVSFYLRLLEEGGAENLLFLIPSLLIRAGISGESVYKLLLSGCNVVTALIGYYCFYKMFSDKIVGLVGAMIYSWLPYRLNNLYCRGDLGEALAMSFLPILCYGFFRLYTDDTETAVYRRLWVLLTAGYTLLFQSYLLSFITAAGFTLLLCLLCWQKTVRKPTMSVLLKTVLATGILNAWRGAFLLYRFKGGEFPFSATGNGTIQSRGVYLSNFIQLFFTGGSSNDVAGDSMRGLQPYGLGFVVTLGVLVYFWMRFTGRYAGKAEGEGLRKLAGIMTGMGILLAFMTTNSFPWDWLQRANRLFYGVIVCLYEPTRLMPLVATCLVVTVCTVIWQIRQWESAEIKRYFLTAMVVIAFVGIQYLTGSILRTGEPRSLDGVSYGAEVTEAEYQLENLDISPLDYAQYEGSRHSAPWLLYGAEAVSAAGAVAIFVLAGRKNRVEKV